MSAINEALKKARRQSPSTTTGNNGINLMPLDNAKSVAPWIVPALPFMAAALVVAGVLLVQRVPSPSSMAPVAPSSGTMDMPSTPPALEADISPTKNEGLSVSAREDDFISDASVAENLPVSSALGASPPATVPEHEPAANARVYPSLRLQGIFFDKSNPFVIINSKTLGVGDRVEQVTVEKITLDSVVLTWKGQTKTLTLH